jgi:hypothetical protein
VLKFDDTLRRSLPPIPEDMRPGPCAMGGSDGESLTSMHVWIFQQQQSEDGERLAIASGDSRQPQQKADRWMVRTGLDPESAPFDTSKPAVAIALAHVTTGGKTDVKYWSQAVSYENADADPNGYP